MQTHGILSDAQIAWVESQPGHWLGRAVSRRSAATEMRARGDARGADYCDDVARQYEQRAEECAKGKV